MSGGRLVGIVSERDYVRKVALAERSMLNAKVSEIMTRDVITVGPRDNLQHCMELMTERRLRHLPVLAEGELIGLLSIGDLVKETIAEQADLIRQLEQYIRGEH
jgi:CBS domain-containing protein